jgi:uncharacterized small protein (DUF1192 family)
MPMTIARYRDRPGPDAAPTCRIYDIAGSNGHSWDINWSNGMNGTLSIAELEDRIAILRDNLRQLVEQAAGSSGAQDEERTSERITQQTEELDKLVAERDARMKK